MSELKRIQSLSEVIGQPSARVRVGIGDDAAVVQRPRSGELLFCSDAMVEGVHFDLKYTTPHDLGHKALAACLSDIAAMNGTALHAVISIAMPKTLGESFITEFYEGATALARRFEVDIVGGDLSASRGGLFVDVAVLGQTENVKTRSGARVGDLLAVSGFPGLSAAGLAALQAGKDVPSVLADAHLRPQPRFDLLPSLNANKKLCTSLIDLSDGLASEVAHLARSSKVGFILEPALFPRHPLMLQAAEKLGKNPTDWIFSGGEDYELVVTLDSQLVKKLGQLPKGLTVIGRVVEAAQGVSCLDADGECRPLTVSGYDHFT